jgi:hypothetical protein
MTDAMREKVLATLQNDWATYIERFHRLSLEAQATFLARQGYSRLADLLAHVVAWWMDGSRVIENLLLDPYFSMQDYDVDDFNAQAVSGVRDLDEMAVIESFEATRQQMLKLAMSLPEAAFQNRRILERFQMEVIGHLAEHALPESKA